MKKLFKSSLFFITLFPMGLISCSKYSDNNSNKWDDKITIQVNPGWSWETKGNAFKKAAKLIENKINFLKKDSKFKNSPDVKVELDWSTSDDTIIMQNIISKKHDLGFSSFTTTMNIDQKNILPFIQTKTNSFIFDPLWKTYNKTRDNKDIELRKIADEQTKIFKNLYNNKNTSWNGSIYENFYNKNKKVDFYRGMIWIYGKNKDQAKKAWNDKNWINFRNNGIIHGNLNSGGKFKLQENLFKKHFGKNAFTTLAEEIKNNSSKFKLAKAKDMKNNDFSIAFDDEGSFAWTKKKMNNETNFKVDNAEILIVTEPLKYDIGSFRSNFNMEQAKLIGESFVNLIKEAESKNGLEKTKALSEIYGPNYGYNDYALILNRKSELEDIFKEMIG